MSFNTLQLYNHLLCTFNNDPMLLEDNMNFLFNYGKESNDVRLWVGDGNNGKSTVVHLLQRQYKEIVNISFDDIKNPNFKLADSVSTVVLEEVSKYYDFKYDELCKFAATHKVNLLIISNYQYTSPTGFNSDYVIPTTNTFVFKNKFVPNPTKPNEYRACIGMIDKYYNYTYMFVCRNEC